MRAGGRGVWADKKMAHTHRTFVWLNGIFFGRFGESSAWSEWMGFGGRSDAVVDRRWGWGVGGAAHGMGRGVLGLLGLFGWLVVGYVCDACGSCDCNVVFVFSWLVVNRFSNHLPLEPYLRFSKKVCDLRAKTLLAREKSRREREGRRVGETSEGGHMDQKEKRRRRQDRKRGGKGGRATRRGGVSARAGIECMCARVCQCLCFRLSLFFSLSDPVICFFVALNTTAPANCCRSSSPKLSTHSYGFN